MDYSSVCFCMQIDYKVIIMIVVFKCIAKDVYLHWDATEKYKPIYIKYYLSMKT